MRLKLMLGSGIILVFAVTVFILMRIMPGASTATDFLVIGTLSTFFCILVAFAIFLATSSKRSEMFYRRKK